MLLKRRKEEEGKSLNKTIPLSMWVTPTVKTSQLQTDASSLPARASLAGSPRRAALEALRNVRRSPCLSHGAGRAI